MVGLLFRNAYYADSQEERDEQDGLAELTMAKTVTVLLEASL